MTVKTLSWALNQRLRSLPKLVLIYLAEHADMDGKLAWDAGEELSAVTFSDIGPIQLQKILAGLESSHHIHRYLSSARVPMIELLSDSAG